MLDDLSLYPVPTDFFGADVAALFGSDDPSLLSGWHVIVEEQQADGEYFQLLLREVDGAVEYLVAGPIEALAGPLPCEPQEA